MVSRLEAGDLCERIHQREQGRKPILRVVVVDDHPVSREGQRAVLSAEGEGDSRNTNDDTISRLERLATLKERGILTDEEFREQKRKILGA